MLCSIGQVPLTLIIAVLAGIVFAGILGYVVYQGFGLRRLTRSPKLPADDHSRQVLLGFVQQLYVHRVAMALLAMLVLLAVTGILELLAWGLCASH